MITTFKADFVHEVRERNKADGLGSFPPPAPFVNWFGFFLHRRTLAARALLAAWSQHYTLNVERLVAL